MPFSVTCFTADANNDIVFVDWQYSNTDGTLTNTHVLATPAGDVPLAEVTQEILVGWLEDQLENTAEEFDAAIANIKAQDEYQAGFKKYNRAVDNTYALLVEEMEAGEVEEAEEDTAIHDFPSGVLKPSVSSTY